MYQIKEESLDLLSETSRQLFAKLQSSQFWLILRDEPLIQNFLDSLREVEVQIKVAKEKKDGPNVAV